MDESFLKEIENAVAGLAGLANLTMINADQARSRAQEFGLRTAFGNYNFVSTVKTLSSALTVYLGTSRLNAEAFTQKKRDIIKSAPETIRLVHTYLAKAPLVRIDATMGEKSAFTPGCAFYTSVYRKTRFVWRTRWRRHSSRPSQTPTRN